MKNTKKYTQMESDDTEELLAVGICLCDNVPQKPTSDIEQQRDTFRLFASNGNLFENDLKIAHHRSSLR